MELNYLRLKQHAKYLQPVQNPNTSLSELYADTKIRAFGGLSFIATARLVATPDPKEIPKSITSLEYMFNSLVKYCMTCKVCVLIASLVVTPLSKFIP